MHSMKTRLVQFCFPTNVALLKGCLVIGTKKQNKTNSENVFVCGIICFYGSLKRTFLKFCRCISSELLAPYAGF